MKIDITPIIEIADKIDNICLEMRELECFYLVRLANGKEYSVKWSEKELADFCPNRTVSGKLEDWKASIESQYELAKTALEEGLHPYFTVQIRDEWNRLTGETRRKELDRYEKAHFKRVMSDREKEFGDLVFVKIVRQDLTK